MPLLALFVTHLNRKPLSFWVQKVTKSLGASSQGPSGTQAQEGPQEGPMEFQAQPPSPCPWSLLNFSRFYPIQSSVLVALHCISVSVLGRCWTKMLLKIYKCNTDLRHPLACLITVNNAYFFVIVARSRYQLHTGSLVHRLNMVSDKFAQFSLTYFSK